MKMDEAGIETGAFDGILGCPFLESNSCLAYCPVFGVHYRPFYQLMRQFMLEPYLRTTGEFDYVEVAAMSFEGNRNLNHLSRQLRPLMQSKDDGITEVWNSVLCDVPSLRYITVEELMASVDQVEGVDVEWRGYLKDRYGL